MESYSYGAYAGGPDPLEPPYDLGGIADAIGEEVLDGVEPGEALRDTLRKVLLDRQARRVRDDLVRQIRDRQQEIRGRGRLDGLLDQARALIDAAVEQEREVLSPDLGDQAGGGEAGLGALPADLAQAIRQLADYDWRSSGARRTFERLRLFILGEVLDSQFRGLRQALRKSGPEIIPRIQNMLNDLNEVLATSTQGEHGARFFSSDTCLIISKIALKRFSSIFPQ